MRPVPFSPVVPSPCPLFPQSPAGTNSCGVASPFDESLGRGEGGVWGGGGETFFRKFLLPLPNASLPPFLLTCGTGRVEDGEEGDADVGENGLPEAGEPDDAKDHEQPLDAERHDDVLPDDYAGLGGDGEHFR